MKVLEFLQENNHICEFGAYSQLRVYDGDGVQRAYFFLMQDGSLRVRCGRFGGSMQDWQREIMEEYGKTQTAREYLSAGFAACVGFEPEATQAYLSVWEDAIAAKNEAERKKNIFYDQEKEETQEKKCELQAPEEEVSAAPVASTCCIQEMRTSQIRILAFSGVKEDSPTENEDLSAFQHIAPRQTPVLQNTYCKVEANSVK